MIIKQVVRLLMSCRQSEYSHLKSEEVMSNICSDDDLEGEPDELVPLLEKEFSSDDD